MIELVGILSMGLLAAAGAAAGAYYAARVTAARAREQHEGLESLVMLGMNQGFERADVVATWGDVAWREGVSEYEPDWWNEELKDRQIFHGGPLALEDTLPVVIRDENSGGYWTILSGYTGKLGGKN